MGRAIVKFTCCSCDACRMSTGIGGMNEEGMGSRGGTLPARCLRRAFRRLYAIEGCALLPRSRFLGLCHALRG